MKFALASLGQEPSGQFLEQVQLAERLGFDAYFHNDAKWRRDVYVRLGAAAATTSSIGLGISVMDPFTRHPAVSAQAVATLAEFAPGRFTAIIGAGSHFETLPDLNVSRPLVAVREAIYLMKRLWAGERVSIDGELVRFHDGELEFLPAQPPELWVAARGEKMLALGGEIADGVLIGSFATPPGIAYARRHISAGLKRSARPPGEITVGSWLYTTILEHEDDPIPESIRGGISFAFWSSRTVLTGMLDEIAPDASREFRDFLKDAPNSWHPDVMTEVRRLIPRGLLDSLAVIGTRDQVVGKLQDLERAGVDQAILWLFPRPGQDEVDVLTEFGEGVLPSLRKAVAK